MKKCIRCDNEPVKLPREHRFDRGDRLQPYCGPYFCSVECAADWAVLTAVSEGFQWCERHDCWWKWDANCCYGCPGCDRDRENKAKREKAESLIRQGNELLKGIK